MRRQHVVRSERVGQNAHPDTALVERLDGCLRPGCQDEIGRLDEQLLFQLGGWPADELDHLVALLAAGDGFRVVGDDTAGCPHEIVANMGALGDQLVQVLVDRIGVVGTCDRLTQGNQDGIEIGTAVGAIDDGQRGQREL